MQPIHVAVLGATGYVGARLVLRLLAKGYLVHAIARSKEKLKSCAWGNHPQVILYAADASDKVALEKALYGCSIVYYLIHSMNQIVKGSSRDFALLDRIAAENTVEIVDKLGVKLLIYLGALGNLSEKEKLSKHLLSRAEVATILMTSKARVIVLRAAMIIGSGSASFEMLRYLVDRLPIMITPKWIDTLVQPIAIRNVLEYLLEVLYMPGLDRGIFDIGGPQVLSYRKLMEIYADEANLSKRIIITIPFVTLAMSKIWVKFLTPLPFSMISPLVDGLKNPVLCTNNRLLEKFTHPLIAPNMAIKIALETFNGNHVASSWIDAGKVPRVEWATKDDPSWSGGTIYEDVRKRVIAVPIMMLWSVITEIGGDRGYYYGNWLWKLRGWIDDLFGGVGQGRGRRNKSRLKLGDALQLWRVQHIEAPVRLVLVAEMRLPGEAVLDFTLRAIDSNHTELTQSARFLPKGILGIVYWYAITPLHTLIFEGMLDSITEHSQSLPTIIKEVES